MKEGVFIRKRLGLIFCFLFGLFLIVTFGVLYLLNLDGTNKAVCLLIISCGAVICILEAVFFFFNRNAYLRLSNDRIVGRFGWLGKIDCPIADVDFVFFQDQALKIRLKNRKCHRILGLANAYEICYAILGHMDFEINESLSTLRQRLAVLSSAQKKYTVRTVCGVLLSFVVIFIAIILTDAKELSLFDRADWIVFAIMCVLELGLIVFNFYSAIHSRKPGNATMRLNYLLHRKAMETTPLPASSAQKVFVSPNYSTRLLLLSASEDSPGDYLIEAFDWHHELQTVYRSDPTAEGYAQETDELRLALCDLIDISARFGL